MDSREDGRFHGLVTGAKRSQRLREHSAGQFQAVGDAPALRPGVAVEAADERDLTG